MKYYVIPNLNEINKYLDLSNEYNLGFEYNEFYNPKLLDNEEELNKTIDAYKKLNRKNDTIHGVFYDITLDSCDPKISAISLERVRKSLDIALKLNCKGVIFHTNYITWMKDEKYQTNWVNKNKEIYLKLIEEYKDLEIYIENMFDDSPDLLYRLVSEINHERIGVCLDVAHAMISNIDISEWFNKLNKYIKHIHINDNDRKIDSHTEIGKGLIDFNLVYKYMNKLDPNTTVLIEIKDYQKTLNSINYLKAGDFNAFK